MCVLFFWGGGFFFFFKTRDYIDNRDFEILQFEKDVCIDFLVPLFTDMD